MTSIKIEVDTTQAQEATAVLEKLALAANTASDALAKLDGQAHGGISIQIVGSMAICNVQPARAGEDVIEMVKAQLPTWVKQMNTDGGLI